MRPLLLLLVLAAAAGAQPILPSFLGLWKPVVGRGALYQVNDRAHQVEEIEVAVVAQEGPDYWLETRYEGLDRRKIRQLLGAGGVLRVLTHEGNDTRELPAGSWQGGGLPVDVSKLGQAVGTETLTVPAGRFTCTKYQIQQPSALVWLDPAVAPYGLVRLQSRELSMELKQVLTGVVSHFP